MWGAATSAYQVEGDNANSDWYQWEKKAGKEHSAGACHHYELYKQDFDIAKSLNHNAHRLSIEWARIEPQEGKFDEVEIRHYIEVIMALRERGMEPFVTLHHFTNPTWFSEMGGWTNKRAAHYFARYAAFVTTALAPYVHYWMTINEPTIYFSHAYIFGCWPPQMKSYFRAKAVHDNFMHAHIQAYGVIHKIYHDLHIKQPSVGIAQHMQAFVPCTTKIRDRVASYLREQVCNFEILDTLMRHKSLDFIGLNYYSRQLVEVKNWGLKSMATDTCGHGHDPVDKNSLGWDIYPQGLQDLLLKLRRYKIPIVISENGICTLNDQQRWDFLRPHLKSMSQAIEQGANVIGYLYWSLMDNFEWDKGFGPRFGLIDINYKTYQRTIRESALKFAQVCKTGIVT